MDERMTEIKGVWKWTNTMQQLADGLTKVQVRQNFAEIMRRRWHAMKFDPAFEAGKKLTAQQRVQADDDLDEVAQQQEDVTYNFDEDDTTYDIIEDALFVTAARRAFPGHLGFRGPGALGCPAALRIRCLVQQGSSRRSQQRRH